MKLDTGLLKKSLIVSLNMTKKIFLESAEITGKRPETLITDGLPAYHSAFNDEFYTYTKPQSQHINAIKLTGHGILQIITRWNVSMARFEIVRNNERFKDKRNFDS
jgi:hypothetical protein